MKSMKEFLNEKLLAETAPPGMEDTVMALKKKFPGDHARAFKIAWSMYDKKHGKSPKHEEVQLESFTDAEGFTYEQIDEKYLGFNKLKAKLSGKVSNPGAVAAAIGRKKYGKKKFQNAAAHDHKMRGESVIVNKLAQRHIEMVADTVRSMRNESAKIDKALHFVDTLSERYEGFDEEAFLVSVGVLDEAVSRKDFKSMAHTISQIEDPYKRRELAFGHAKIYAKLNPRFDHEKFFKAANVPVQKEETEYFTEESGRQIAWTMIQKGKQNALLTKHKGEEIVITTSPSSVGNKVGHVAEFGRGMKIHYPAGHSLAKVQDHVASMLEETENFDDTLDSNIGISGVDSDAEQLDEAPLVHLVNVYRKGNERVHVWQNAMHGYNYDAEYSDHKHIHKDTHKVENHQGPFEDLHHKLVGQGYSPLHPEHKHHSVDPEQYKHHFESLSDEDMDFMCEGKYSVESEEDKKNMRHVHSIAKSAMQAAMHAMEIQKKTGKKVKIFRTSHGKKVPIEWSGKEDVDAVWKEDTLDEAKASPIPGADMVRSIMRKHLSGNRKIGGMGGTFKYSPTIYTNTTKAGHSIKVYQGHNDKKSDAMHKEIVDTLTKAGIKHSVNRTPGASHYGGSPAYIVRIHHPKIVKEETIVEDLDDGEGIYSVHHNGELKHTTLFKHSAVQVAKQLHGQGGKVEVFHRKSAGYMGHSYGQIKQPIDWQKEGVEEDMAKTPLSESDRIVYKAYFREKLEEAKMSDKEASRLADVMATAKNHPVANKTAMARERTKNIKAAIKKNGGLGIPYSELLNSKKPMAKEGYDDGIEIWEPGLPGAKKAHARITGEHPEVAKARKGLADARRAAEVNMKSGGRITPMEVTDKAIAKHTATLKKHGVKEEVEPVDEAMSAIDRAISRTMSRQRKMYNTVVKHRKAPKGAKATGPSASDKPSRKFFGEDIGTYASQSQPQGSWSNPNSEHDSNPGYVVGVHQIGGKVVKIVRMGNMFAPVKIVQDDNTEWRDTDGQVFEFQSADQARDAYWRKMEAGMTSQVAATQSGEGGQYPKDALEAESSDPNTDQQVGSSE